MYKEAPITGATYLIERESVCYFSISSIMTLNDPITVKSLPISLLLTSTPSLPNRVDGLEPEMNDLITSPLLVTNCVLNITITFYKTKLRQLLLPLLFQKNLLA